MAAWQATPDVAMRTGPRMKTGPATTIGDEAAVGEEDAVEEAPVVAEVTTRCRTVITVALPQRKRRLLPLRQALAMRRNSQLSLGARRKSQRPADLLLYPALRLLANPQLQMPTRQHRHCRRYRQLAGHGPSKSSRARGRHNDVGGWHEHTIPCSTSLQFAYLQANLWMFNEMISLDFVFCLVHIVRAGAAEWIALLQPGCAIYNIQQQ